MAQRRNELSHGEACPDGLARPTVQVKLSASELFSRQSDNRILILIGGLGGGL